MSEPARPWSQNELDLVDRARELQLAIPRPDGSIRPFVTVWMVRVGTDLYVRSGSGYGSVSKWFPRARDARTGIVRVEDHEWSATFSPVDPNAAVHAEIDGAYLRKYGGSFGMTDAATHEHTLRITPTAPGAAQPPIATLSST